MISKIRVCAQGVRDWNVLFDAQMTAGILLDQYCGSFSFDKAKYHLCHDKVQLEPSRVLQDLCAQAVRQYKGKQPGKQLVVQLEAVIQPSVAYFLWVSLSRVQLQASTATDWHDHLQTVVTDQGPFASLFVSQQSLSSFLAVKPTESFPVTTEGPACDALVPAPIAPQDVLQPLVVLILEHLRHHNNSATMPTAANNADVGALHNSSTALLPSSPSASATECSELPSNSEEQHRSRHQPKQKPTELLVLLLRSALLVLKLASLVQHVSLEGTPTSNIEVDKLWETLNSISAAFFAIDTTSDTVKHGPQPNSSAEAIMVELSCLAVALLRLLLLVARQALQSDWVCIDVCCRSLWRLVRCSDASMRRAMAAEVGKSGAVAVLMRIVERKRLAGQFCLVLLVNLAFAECMPVPLKAHIQGLLLKADGMLCCSMQLCPWFSTADELKYPEAVTVFSSSWVESSTVARSFKVEDVQTMLDQLSFAVYMVHQLTVLGNPCRLQQAPPRVSFKASQAEVLPHASSKLHLEVSTTGVTCARISLSEQGIDTGSVSQRLASECCQALPGGQTDSRPALRGPWPTPTAAEWSKIVQVVTRIAFLLKFLHSLKDEYQHLKEHGQLRVDVMELLCDLLNGHLTNPELDVTKIVVLLFEDVVEELRAIPAERVELSQFRSVLLQRVASDSRLLHSDGIQDPIICPVGSYAVGRLWLSLDKQFLTQPIAAAETIEVIYLLLESQAQCTNLSLSFYIRLPEVQGLALTLTTLASHAQVYTAELVQNTFARDLEERQTIHECLSSAVFQLVTQVNALSPPWPHDVCLGLARLLWRLGQLSVHRQVLLEREGELLLLLSTLLPQLQFVTRNAFLQPVLLQSCIGCLLALLEAGARSGHLPYSSQDTIWSMLAATPGVCSAVRRPVTEFNDPKTLGLPRLTPDEASDALLSLSMQMCQMANLWPMFGQQIFPFWVEQWWLGVSQQFDRAVHYSDSEWLQNPLKNPLDSKIYLAMISHTPEMQLLERTQTPSDSDSNPVVLVRAASALLYTLLAGVVHLAMAQVVADKLERFIAQIRSSALQHIRNTARVNQEHPIDTASAGIKELVLSQQLQLADLLAGVDVTKASVGSVLSCLDGLVSDIRWEALLAGMKCLPGSEFGGASTQQNVSKYMTCLARKQWLLPSTIAHIERYMLNSTQAATLQTEASASRAAQQLLAEEDQAAALAAAKKAKKKQRQKARKQQTHSEVASGEEASVESTAAPAVVTPSTQAAADCTHSHELTGAHDSAAAATAVVDVHSSAEALQPLDAGKTIESVATSQGQASKDEQHDAAFLQSLFCCPILKAAMIDPVIAADGHTYERVAIDQWLQHRDISPVTGSALAHTRLVPNVLIRKAIACQQQQPQ